MKSTFRKLVAAVSLACLASVATTASAETINFDDLTGGPQFFTSPYHGLTFTDAGSNPPSGSWFWSDVAPPTVFKSPRTSVSTEADLDANGDPTGIETESQRITSATPFEFKGAWFTSLDTGFNTDPNDPFFDPVTVTFCMYLNNVQVGAGQTAVLSLGVADSPYQFLASGYYGPIDSFTVHGLQGYFAMDDLIIPEPSSYALVLFALSGLAFTKRRKNA